MGSFILEEPLARGGFSAVWRARATPGAPGAPSRLPATVAVKIATDPAGRAHLEAELAARPRLEHRAVLPILEHDLEMDAPYIVLPLIEGGSLRDLLGARARLSGRAATALALPIIDVVASLHRAGVTHGDLKPGNFLLEPETRAAFAGGDIPDRPKVWLADLGSVPIRSEIDNTLRTRAGHPATLAYRAPETIATADAPGPAADLFSLGVVLHELVTGTPSPLRFPVLEVSRELSAAIETATARDPDARFRDLDELREALLAKPEWRAAPGRRTPVGSIVVDESAPGVLAFENPVHRHEEVRWSWLVGLVMLLTLGCVIQAGLTWGVLAGGKPALLFPAAFITIWLLVVGYELRRVLRAIAWQRGGLESVGVTPDEIVIELSRPWFRAGRTTHRLADASDLRVAAEPVEPDGDLGWARFGSDDPRRGRTLAFDLPRDGSVVRLGAHLDETTAEQVRAILVDRFPTLGRATDSLV